MFGMPIQNTNTSKMFCLTIKWRKPSRFEHSRFALIHRYPFFTRRVYLRIPSGTDERGGAIPSPEVGSPALEQRPSCADRRDLKPTEQRRFRLGARWAGLRRPAGTSGSAPGSVAARVWPGAVLSAHHTCALSVRRPVLRRCRFLDGRAAAVAVLAGYDCAPASACISGVKST